MKYLCSWPVGQRFPTTATGQFKFAIKYVKMFINKCTFLNCSNTTVSVEFSSCITGADSWSLPVFFQSAFI